MDNETSKDPSSEDFIELPDNILLSLAKSYVNKNDGFALALSGAFGHRFGTFYGEVVDQSMSFSISRHYFLAPIQWESFFKNHISPLCLKEFDATHCYWIPATVLCDAVTQMGNLETLLVHDTQISLAHLPRLFEACQKVEKFSFSLAEKNLDALQQENHWLKMGFGKVKDLKIIAFNFGNILIGVNAWSMLLEVLKWCRTCLHLTIELAFTETGPENPRRDTWLDQQELFPCLAWMLSLKSFIFIKRGPYFSVPVNNLVYRLTSWLLNYHPATSFEHLWLEGDRPSNGYHMPSSKSLIFDGTYVHPQDLDDVQFRHLQNVGGLPFSSYDVLGDLKYFRGYCTSDQGLSDFCRHHPMLESLHFDTAQNNDRYSIGDGNWQLPNLKIVAYHCRALFKEVVDHLIVACPNITALHIGFKYYQYVQSQHLIKNINVLGVIQFHCLSSLTLDGFDLKDGSYLSSIFKQCPKLEILHLGDKFDSSVFLSNLGECLPNAKNLRDLRLKWQHEENQSDVLLFFKNLQLGCAKLERLVLSKILDEVGITKGRCRVPDWINLDDFGDFVVTIALNMKRLVLLCLSGFQIDPDVIKELNRRVAEEIVPDRPAFWFHLGLRLPKENDPSVPRIHHDEIINPIDWFYAPPKL